MSWPFPQPVLVSKNEGRRAAYERKREAHEREIEELRRRKAEREPSPVDPVYAAICETLRSEAFAEWYLALTDKESREWVDSVLNVQPRILRALGTTFPQWVEQSYRQLVQKYRLRDKTSRQLMAAEVRDCKDPYKRRRLILRLATPRWANPMEIAKIYRRRDRATRESGVSHEVDHIVPLLHPLVCGLHVEQNLQVIPKTRNQQKLNKFVVE